MLHTSLLLGSSPDRYARGSANRLNAVIASTTQLGSPRNHTPAVEFYLYPTVGTVLIHSIKPELTE